MRRLRPIAPAPRWLVIVGCAALTVVFITLLFPRWHLKALSGAETTYFKASILWFPGFFMALMILAGIGSSISLLRNPYDPLQRLLGAVLASVGCFLTSFALAAVPLEYETLPFHATGWVAIGRWAAFVATFAFIAPLFTFMHGRILDDTERQGEGHPSLSEFED